jgi:hypothetical protein
MSGTIPPLPHYAFMAWCLVKAQCHLLCVDRPANIAFNSNSLRQTSLTYLNERILCVILKVVFSLLQAPVSVTATPVGEVS